MGDDNTVQKAVDDVMSCDCAQTLLELVGKYQIPQRAGTHYPKSYLSTLEGSDLLVALRCILVAFYITSGREIPREHQVHAVRLSFSKDSAIIAGTGSGKTLITAILIWMSGKDRISITISPLQRLQATQEKDFLTKYMIPTLAINHSTNRTADFWRENVFDNATKTLGRFRHLIVTPEQLFKLKEGYYSRIGLLIRNNPWYKTRIRRWFVDEAHFIHYAGHDHYTRPAFRITYGRLAEIKIQFSSVPWHALTATAPPHVFNTIRSAVLSPDCNVVNYSCNRPNTIYAMHCVDGTIDNLNNYNMFVKEPFDFHTQPRVLLFFDNKTLCAKVRQHLMERLPANGLPFPREKIVQFYRTGMSDGYLERVHSEFADRDGPCKIYCTTKANSTGIDYPDVDIVVNVDVPPDVPEGLQRAGRVVRASEKTGLFLILYEAWVVEIDLDEFTVDHMGVDPKDPDRPRKALSDKSTRQERVPRSFTKLIQDGEKCLREFFAEYLNDKSTSALDFNGSHCCHRHNNRFNLQQLVPGSIWTSQTSEAEQPTRPPPKKYNKYRPTVERPLLDEKLRFWRRIASRNDTLCRPEYHILGDEHIVEVARALPSKIQTPEALKMLLEETDEWRDEWGQEILNIVTAFDSQERT
ncbi:hypothetical protein AAF712_009546 [Marasmius tenuissimus]|uniref:DNA 3'-5' helicase n=1 Tax=Marasmius tenuissimus TaxID=585030 RepID=A0ABR2ZR37_9AGAR